MDIPVGDRRALLGSEGTARYAGRSPFAPLPRRVTARAAARRFLSEFRDEYVDRSDLLSRVYRAVRG